MSLRILGLLMATALVSSSPNVCSGAELPGSGGSAGFPGIATLNDAVTHQATTFDLAKRSKTFHVKRGERVDLAQTTGTGVITAMWMTFPGWFWQHWNQDQPVDQSILKTLIVRIYWDGSDTPAVQAPVGDFFGNGLCEISNYTSRYFGMSSGGFYTRFPMPYRKGFRVEVENLDKTIDTEVFCNVLYQEQPVPENAAYFHAQFHTGKNPGPDPTPILQAEGRGQYVGCVLSMQGEKRGYMSYLEAPEYVYVDDDWTTPRLVGTGLEDYFMGGWYFREGEFTGDYHGVPSKDSLNASIVMYRVHDADAIHFKKRIRFDFVNPWSPDRLQPFAWSSVAFYYLDSPAGQQPELPTDDKLIPWFRTKNTDRQSIP